MSFRHAGFTLVELVVTIAVMAVVMAIAFPSMQNTLRSTRVSTATNDAVSLIALARTEAVRSTRGGGVCASADGATCGENWSAGWLAWADANADGVLDAGEVVLRFSSGNRHIVVAGPDAPITFDARGLRSSDGSQAISIQPDSCGDQSLRRTLTVTPTGQVQTQVEACI